MNTNKFGAKSNKIYECKVCDYKSDKKYGYDRHILTNKHKLLTDTNLIGQKRAKKEYNCCCGKKYNFQSSLCYHKKKCEYKVHAPVPGPMHRAPPRTLKSCWCFRGAI